MSFQTARGAVPCMLPPFLTITARLFFQLAEKYGPIFTLHFGFQKVVVLTGYEVVREALVNYTEEFVDRPSIPIFDQIQNRNGTRAMTGGVGGTTLSHSACDDDEAQPNCASLEPRC